MLTILKAFYNQNFANPQYNICLLGIECSGKTKFASQVKQLSSDEGKNQNTSYKPTVGLNVIKCKTAKGQLCLWDLGGKRTLRKIWEHYYQECHGIVFFIDDRIQEGFNCLLNVLFHPDMLMIPVVIIASNEEVKVKIQKQLNQTEKSDALNRKIIIELAFSDVLTDTQAKMKIRQLLNWIYDNIQKIHSTVKVN